MNLSRLYTIRCTGRSGDRICFHNQARSKLSTSSKCSTANVGEKSPFKKGLFRKTCFIRHNSDTSRLSEKLSVLHQQRLSQQECVRYYGVQCPPTDTCIVTLSEILSSWNQKRVETILDSTLSVRSLDSFRQRKNAKIAAVLVPLCTVHDEPSILFTLRSDKLAKHKSEVSFPGGNMERCDKDIAYTALRETYEELGIHPDYFQVWGAMPAILTRDCKLVHPVVASTGEMDICNLSINSEEVQEVFTVKIKDLCDNSKIRSTQFRTGSGYTLPVYLGGPHKIWGLTSTILHQTLTALAPGLYTYKLKHAC